jgi:hypothetical protein
LYMRNFSFLKFVLMIQKVSTDSFEGDVDDLQRKVRKFPSFFLEEVDILRDVNIVKRD